MLLVYGGLSDETHEMPFLQLGMRELLLVTSDVLWNETQSELNRNLSESLWRILVRNSLWSEQKKIVGTWEASHSDLLVETHFGYAIIWETEASLPRSALCAICLQWWPLSRNVHSLWPGEVLAETAIPGGRGQSGLYLTIHCHHEFRWAEM